jgi:hypothetical protein
MVAPNGGNLPRNLPVEIRKHGIFMKQQEEKKKHEKWIEWWSFNGALLTHILSSTLVLVSKSEPSHPRSWEEPYPSLRIVGTKRWHLKFKNCWPKSPKFHI